MDPKNNKQVVKTPWYKIPMVWFIMALPLAAVVASIATLVIAAKHPPQILEHNQQSSKIITPVEGGARPVNNLQ